MDELEISGKRYISTRRAGKEHGYHSDYIGQLIRGGKVSGTKVGRAWYVEEDSFRAYLGKESQPIADLIHTAKPQSTALEDTVQTNIVETHVEEPQPVQVIEEKIEEPVVKKVVEETQPESEIQAQVEIKKEKEEQPIVIRREFSQGEKLTYITDDEPLLPPVSRSRAPHEDIETTREKLILMPARPPRHKKIFSASMAVVLIAFGLIALSTAASAYVGSTVQVIQGQPATVYYSIGQ